MTYLSRHPFWAAIFIFVLALLPRLYALDTFLTIDEVKWAEGAAQFLVALDTSDLARTYWHFFPGVTIAWGGALTLWATCLPAPDIALCAQTHVEHLPESIGWLRLTPVLITSVGVAGVYLLGRKLLDEKAALLAALLLAFDPFFIAHSRILNGDAITAILMFLSLVTFLIYWRGEVTNIKFHPSFLRHRSGQALIFHPALMLSGALAGLALLTKLPAPFVALFIGGVGVVALALDWRQEGWLAVRRWVAALALWGVIALVVVFLGWPALWVAPGQTLRQMYADSFEVGEVGEGHDTFFVGQTLDDPGPWFYPYTVAFRLTPVVMVGLLVLVGWLVWQITMTITGVKRHEGDALRPSSQGAFGSAKPPLGTHYISPINFPDAEPITIWVILSFVVLMIVFAGLSPKKLDRYVMGVIPALIFLSAIGLSKIAQGGRGAGGQGRNIPSAPLPLCSPALSLILLAGLVALHLVSALLAAPYYLTYYNPLLGGPRRAVAQVPAGWGEGLEQAAHYLNNLPEAQSLSVSSWYGDIFQPYFTGQRASFADDGRAQLAADYVVFYVNQIQREKPYAGLINYFRAGEPVFILYIDQLGRVSSRGGTPWVEVYRAPAAQSASGAPKI
ncbi:MAG: glycosyltransferase family 39 protein, partial [Chloroflexi bacterium]|nr:glycosyltransferase family 39 protein [Chloroflexota bacterium]